MAGCGGCIPGDNPVQNKIGYRTKSLDAILFLSNGGNNYNVGDKITIAGGQVEDGENAAIFNVDSESGGVITGLSIFDGGVYRVAPSISITQESVTPPGGSGVEAFVSYLTSSVFTPDQSPFIIGSIKREWNTSWDVSFPAAPCPSPSNVTHQFNRNDGGWENTGTVTNQKGCMAATVTISALIGVEYYQTVRFTRVGDYLLRTVHVCGQASNSRAITVVKSASSRRVIFVN